MTDPKIIKRIKALFAMSQETEASPHEAEIAMRRVAAMLEKHQLTVDDINKQENAFGQMAGGKSYTSMPRWYWVMGTAAGNITESVVIKGHQGNREILLFRGIETDNQAGLLMFDYLIAQTKRAIKENGIKGASNILDFRKGFASALFHRSRDVVKERHAARQEQNSSSNGTALVVVDKMQLISDSFQPSKLSRSRAERDSEARRAGFDAGMECGINNQVGGSAKPRLK